MKLPDKKELFTIPNIMSYFRIILLPIIAYAIFNDYYIAEVVLILISALTDFLDGKIARRLNQVTELGKALDPVADKLTLCVLFMCMTLKIQYAWIVAVVMLIKELYMLIMQYILLKKSKKTSGSARWYGKFCTAALFIALAAYIAFPAMPAAIALIIAISLVVIMIFTIIMYALLFHELMHR